MREPCARRAALEGPRGGFVARAALGWRLMRQRSAVACQRSYLSTRRAEAARARTFLTWRKSSEEVPIRVKHSAALLRLTSAPLTLW